VDEHPAIINMVPAKISFLKNILLVILLFLLLFEYPIH
jgi:hypothetical protein